MRGRSVQLALALGLAAAATHSTLQAQAWIPPKDQGSFNVSIGQSSMGDHLFSSKIYAFGESRSQDLGTSNSRSMMVGFSYGVLDRFAISADVAYVTARYEGDQPDNPAIDNGEWHGSAQDLRMFFRYQAYRSRAFVVTPLAGFVLPVNDYESMGHSAVGNHKWEIPVGVSLGAPFGNSRPLAYLVATAAYSFVEKIHDMNTNRVNAGLEVGGFPHPNVTLRLYGAWQNTFGGIDWTEIDDAQAEQDHDAAAKADYWAAGGGVAWSINRSFDLYAGYSEILSGSNTTKLSTFSLGMSWNFGKGITDRRKIGAREGPPSASRRGEDAAPTTAAIYAGLRGW